MMRPLVFATTLMLVANSVYALPKPPVRFPSPTLQAPLSEKSSSGFFSKQNWSDGTCRVEVRQFGSGPKFFLMFDYNPGDQNQSAKTETMLPRLNPGESFSAKECHRDANVIITNQNIFVFPGARSLLEDPIEDRTFVAYAGDIRKHLNYQPLEFVILFGDGSIFLAKIVPKTKDIVWKEVANVPTDDITNLFIDGNTLVVTSKNGKKERFDL